LLNALEQLTQLGVWVERAVELDTKGREHCMDFMLEGGELGPLSTHGLFQLGRLHERRALRLNCRVHLRIQSRLEPFAHLLRGLHRAVACSELRAKGVLLCIQRAELDAQSLGIRARTHQVLGQYVALATQAEQPAFHLAHDRLEACLVLLLLRHAKLPERRQQRARRNFALSTCSLGRLGTSGHVTQPVRIRQTPQRMVVLCLELEGLLLERHAGSAPRLGQLVIEEPRKRLGRDAAIIELSFAQVGEQCRDLCSQRVHVARRYVSHDLGKELIEARVCCSEQLGRALSFFCRVVGLFRDLSNALALTLAPWAPHHRNSLELVTQSQQPKRKTVFLLHDEACHVFVK
jgi:hypothetical protein